MEMVEQNISGIKLEKLRQEALKKHKIQRRLLPVCFLVFAGLSLLKEGFLFLYIGQYGWGDAVSTGGLWMLLGDLMMSAMLSAVIYVFYMMLVWQKAYDRFNFSFKNKYVLDTIRQLPGFSELRYNTQGGFSYEEMCLMNLIPKGEKVFYKSFDELRGVLDGVRFRAANVFTGKKANGRRSLPDTLFEGQIVTFSTFDDRKISQGFVQKKKKKALSEIKNTTAPLNIQTENSVFNENFVVFAENEQNAFYILTPHVLEHITAFQEAMEGKVYLAFCDKTMYVTCAQMRNPFDALIDVPIAQQRSRIEEDTRILRSAREILVRAAQDGRA